MISSSPQNPVTLYYTTPIPGDFRQGDIYRDVLQIALSASGFRVLRPFTASGGREAMRVHGPEDEPQGGFRWGSKEQVQADGQLGLAVVLTHDCEIENDDSSHHRLIGLLRPLDPLSAQEKDTVIEGRHIGRLYVPSWHDVGLPESYLDLRRITTVRQNALPDDHRIASMTDFGRTVLQRAIIQYLTEMYRDD